MKYTKFLASTLLESSLMFEILENIGDKHCTGRLRLIRVLAHV